MHLKQNATKWESAGTVPPESMATTNNPFSIYFLNGQDGSIPANAAAIRLFVARGGGLVTGAQVGLDVVG